MKRPSYIFLSLLFFSACPKSVLDVGDVKVDSGPDISLPQTGGAAGGEGEITGTGGSIVYTGGAAGGEGEITGTGGSIVYTGNPGSGVGGSAGGAAGADEVSTGGSTGAGGATNTTVLDLIPRSNTVPGWVVDPSNAKTARDVAAVATTQRAAEELIDGAAEDFWGEVTVDKVPRKLAWQNYVNPSLLSPAGSTDGSNLQLLLFEMPSNAAAAGLYAWLVKDNQYPLWNEQWEEPSSPMVGTKYRLANSGSDWWINFYKGNYYVEIRLTPSYGPAPDYLERNATQRAAALNFAMAVASRIPSPMTNVGASCDVGRPIDKDTDRSANIYNDQSLECSSHLCVKPAVDANSSWVDTGALCTKMCNSDNDCAGLLRDPSNPADKRCTSGFVCGSIFALGRLMCTKLCVCEDFFEAAPPTPVNCR